GGACANTVTVVGAPTAATYAAAIPHVLADPHVSACIVLFVPAVTATADEIAQAVVETVERAESDKPVLAVIMTSEGTPVVLRGTHRVASFAYPESAARGLGRGEDRAARLRCARAPASRRAPPGCGARRARCPRSTRSTASGRKRSSSGRSTPRRTRGSTLPRRALCSRATGSTIC